MKRFTAYVLLDPKGHLFCDTNRKPMLHTWKEALEAKRWFAEQTDGGKYTIQCVRIVPKHPS